MVGLFAALTKPLGPVKLITPPLAVNVKLPPTQTGALLSKLAVGVFITVTLDTAEFVQPAALVTVTVYPPDMALVEFDMVGFCKAELNAKGPDHK
jgi:hypothetical protein